MLGGAILCDVISFDVVVLCVLSFCYSLMWSYVACGVGRDCVGCGAMRYGIAAIVAAVLQ